MGLDRCWCIKSPSTVLDFWFSKRAAWFCADPEKRDAVDEEIREKYGECLAELEQVDTASMVLSELNPTQLLSCVVVLDQFSRHVYRRSESDRIALNTEKAAVLVESAIKAGWLVHYQSTERLMFFMMPLRHNETKERLQLCAECQASVTASEAKLAQRVTRAIAVRLAKFERANADVDDVLGSPEKTDRFDAAQLLESDVAAQALKNLDRSKAYIVSLSGGVDSMLLLRVLQAASIKLIAVHVDYGCRKEHGREREYLVQYCAKIGVDLRVLDISAMPKNSDWDDNSRSARFAFYKQHGSDVCTGHIFDDVMENLLMNLFASGSKSGPTNLLTLTGMRTRGVVRSVSLWRPLLYVKKVDIVSTAARFGLPYFNDTSLNVALRIQVRRVLIPTIVDMFPNTEDRLRCLAASVEDLRGLVHRQIIDPYIERVQTTDVDIILPFKDSPRSTEFWKLVMDRVLISNGIKMTKHKALATLAYMKRDSSRIVKLGSDVGMRLEGGKLMVRRPSKATSTAQLASVEEKL